MSKSLKNFISIDDYLRAQITSAPADDFRMYCLRHKYHATLSYSTTQVQDAARLRAKFESFFASAVVVLKSGGRGSSAAAVERSRRSTPESTRLTEHLIRAQQEVHTALGEDFNTPVVLNALSALAGEAVLYLALVLTPRAERGPDGAQVFQQPLEPLFSSAAYVGRILTMLGLRFPAAFQLDAGSAVALEGEGGDGVSAEKEGAGLNDGAVDAIVQFRATVREAALQGVKALRVKKKSGESLTATELELQEQLQGILSASDASREKLGKTLGIKIEDLAALSKWTRI